MGDVCHKSHTWCGLPPVPLGHHAGIRRGRIKASAPGAPASPRCVEIRLDNPANGADMLMGTCTAFALPQWFEAVPWVAGGVYHLIRHRGSNRCWDLPAASAALAGAQFILQPCADDRQTQLFWLKPDGSIVNRVSGMCADAGPSLADATGLTPLQQKACNTSVTLQKFTFDAAGKSCAGSRGTIMPEHGTVAVCLHHSPAAVHDTLPALVQSRLLQSTCLRCTPALSTLRACTP